MHVVGESRHGLDPQLLQARSGPVGRAGATKTIVRVAVWVFS